MGFAGSDFNETEDFDEYDPNPYNGGYDIALTYGAPLAPSPSICYPLSAAADSPPPPLPPPPSLPAPSPPPSRREEPPAVEETPNPNPSPNSQESEHAPPYGYSPDLSGFWPFLAALDGRRDDAEEQAYWGPWRRAADYLFGFSQGLGERRIGMDSYGIPIYACKSHGNRPLLLEVESARDQKLDYYDADLDQFGRKDENNGYGNPAYAYHRHYYEQPLSVQMDPIEPTLSQKLCYNEVYEEQVYPEPKWIEPTELNWSQKPSYHEDYQEQTSFKSNWHSSYSGWQDDKHFFGNSHHAYERHYNEQPLCIELEPFKPTWSQNPDYYKVCEGEVPSNSNWKLNHHEVYQEPASPRSSWRDGINISSDPYYAEERHYSGQPAGVDLEPFKPTWSQNSSFYEAYEGEVPSNWHSLLSTEQGDGASFGNPNYAYERHSYEKSICVQIEPYKPTWSLNPSFYEVMEEAYPESN